MQVATTETRHKGFIDAFVRFGSVRRACEEVGLPFATGYSIVALPQTVNVVLRYLNSRRAQSGLVSLRVLEDIADDINAPHAARVAAARALGEHAGMFGTGREPSVSSDREPHEMSTDELHSQVQDLERELGQRARVVPVSCPVPDDLIDLY